MINVVVMQGMKGQTGGQQVMVYDEASGQGSAMDLLASPGRTEARQAWTAFGKSLHQHMKSRGLEKAMCWGYPLETEVDPDLKNVLRQAVPEVGWAVGPHEMMYNATYVKDARSFKVITTIRYNGGWPAFRMDQGWKSQTTHLLSPRVGGTVFALHTTSEPFAYRVLPDHALALGRNGFSRVGADEWAAIHHDGMVPAQWQTGIPVLFVLWPGPAGAESSARFECLLEGIQETEGRIFLEQAVDRGAVSGPLAVKIRKTLSENLDETRFFLGNSMLRAFEEYSYNWQERSRRVYELAAEVARAQGVARP